ncbi:hypothetical protein Tco_1507804 [Tanacetum coccineum]
MRTQESEMMVAAGDSQSIEMWATRMTYAFALSVSAAKYSYLSVGYSSSVIIPVACTKEFGAKHSSKWMNLGYECVHENEPDASSSGRIRGNNPVVETGEGQSSLAMKKSIFKDFGGMGAN